MRRHISSFPLLSAGNVLDMQDTQFADRRNSHNVTSAGKRKKAETFAGSGLYYACRRKPGSESSQLKNRTLTPGERAD
jgi:hypothetical protein